jgi:N-acetylmuramic acid 6-phosphate etherase
MRARSHCNRSLKDFSQITQPNEYGSHTLFSGYLESVMGTESPSPRYSDIDLWDLPEMLEALVEGQFAAVAAVRAARAGLERAALAMENRLKHKGRLAYAGAGTSGRLAVQDGAELMPTFSWPADRLILLMAGGTGALLRSKEGAEDEVENAARLVRENRINEKDVLIAVAASGTTPFTVTCLRESKQRGALTIGIANNAGAPILEHSDHPIWLDTGAEPIAGSTRLKAGTAQKITLNILSTLLMIRLGRVHDGLMVDLQATNEKLHRRSEEILIRLTGRSRDEASSALRRARGSVKIAVMLLHGCEPHEAEALLKSADGRLRTALSRIGRHGSNAA